MKKYRVLIPPVVQEQILAQVLYIAQRSPENAAEWEKRLRKAICAMGAIAGVHAVDRDVSERLGFIVHKMVFEKTYLIHYQVNEDGGVVKILNFRHGARLPRPDEA